MYLSITQHLYIQHHFVSESVKCLCFPDGDNQYYERLYIKYIQVCSWNSINNYNNNSVTKV